MDLSSYLSFEEITSSNLSIAKKLHLILFPIKMSFSYYKKLIQKESKEFGFVVCFEGKGVGVFTIRKEKELLYIMNFGVLSSYRRNGIGSAMFSFLFENQKNIKIISLHTPVERKGEFLFYQRNGFKIEKRIKNYYKTFDAFYLIRKKEDFLSTETSFNS